MKKRLKRCIAITVLSGLAGSLQAEKQSTDRMLPLVVQADEETGVIHNLWDTRVIVDNELWPEPGFPEMMKATTKNVKHINNVRALGGRKDHLLV